MFNFAFALVDPVGFRLTKWNVNLVIALLA
ncbi:hypothetical protein CDIF28669_01645 [Clostridioides difficile]|nr:hypothetical protein CDIF28669_01645 [Clostridioides difficile]